MTTAPPPRPGTPLGQRENAQAPAAQPRTRHVWVTIDGTTHAGILLAWRPSGARWRAHVAFAVVDDPSEPGLVVQWIDAQYVKPARTEVPP